MLPVLAIAVSSCKRGDHKTAGGRIDYTTIASGSTVTSPEPAAAPAASGYCAQGMVLVPSGPTFFGPTEEKGKVRSTEEPRRIDVSSFCIDKYEYPNRYGEQPARGATWLEARDMCGKNGKRLCSEQEFEKACRGPSATLYTYGDGFFAKACPAATDTYNSGEFTECVSGFGVFDMSGGLYEWVEGGLDDSRVLRGGLTLGDRETTSRCTFQQRADGKVSNRESGYRCCANPTSKIESK